MNTFPYCVRKQAGQTNYHFLIYDETAKSWYDSPPGLRVELNRPVPILAGREASIGWPEMDIIRQHIALPGAVAVECGCHHGLTSILLAAWVGAGGFVHAFDAVLQNACIAQRNLALNCLTNAAVYCAGIGGHYGIATMTNTSNVVLHTNDSPSPQSTLIMPIDRFFPQPPDAIKIDVEGKELEVALAHKQFLRAIPRIAMEIHSDYLPLRALEQIVCALGDRHIRILAENGELTAFKPNVNYGKRCHLFSWPL